MSFDYTLLHSYSTKDLEWFNAIISSSTALEMSEASLGRVYQHVLDSKDTDKTFAILTSWRGADPDEENDRNYKQFLEDIKGLNLGYFGLIGHGQEEDPKEKGEVVPSKEPAVFVPGMKKIEAISLCKKYNQWGFIFGGPDARIQHGHIVGLYTTEDKLVKSGPWSPKMIGEFYSEIRRVRNSKGLRNTKDKIDVTRTGKKRKLFTSPDPRGEVEYKNEWMAFEGLFTESMEYRIGESWKKKAIPGIREAKVVDIQGSK